MPRIAGSGNRDSAYDSNLAPILPVENTRVSESLVEIPSPSASAAAQTQFVRRCDTLIEIGEARSKSGEYAAAQEALRKAAELAERLHDQGRLARIVAALPCWHWWGPGQANPLALLLAQRGMAIEREDDRRRAVFMARAAAEFSCVASEQARSHELAEAALDLAAGDSRTELLVRLFYDQLLLQPECASERLRNAEDIVRLALEVGDYALCFLGCVAQSASLSLRGDFARAGNVAQVTAEVPSVSGSPLHRGISIAWEASRAVMEGRFSEAEKAFERCSNFAARNRIPQLLDACWPAMLMPFSESDRIGELETVAEKTVHRRPGALVFQALLSWIKIKLGKSHDAGFLLDRLAADDYADLGQSDGGWVGIAALSEVCIALNRLDDAAILYKRLSPYADFTAVLGGVVLLGSIQAPLGQLALALGRIDDAVGHFEKSLACNRRIGARPWAAYSRWGLARALLACGGPRDCARAAEVADQLETEADSLQMKQLRARAIELAAQIRSATVSQMALPAPAADPDGFAQDTANREISVAVENGPGARVHEASRVANFRLNGGLWELGFDGRTSWFKHCRGFEFIHFLLRNAGREFFAFQIVHQGRISDPAAGPTNDRGPVGAGAAPILDAQAKHAYRARLKELAEDLEDARQAGDSDRMERIEEEKEFLARELARALGLFDRDRKFSAESDRARRCVRMAISRAISLISSRDEEFAQIFVRSLRTGNRSSFIPRAEDVVHWRL